MLATEPSLLHNICESIARKLASLILEQIVDKGYSSLKEGNTSTTLLIYAYSELELFGSTGCGKTLMAMEFLVRGAIQYNEPGVFMSFEETAQELTQNVASLGFDLNDLAAHKKIFLDNVLIERSEIQGEGTLTRHGLEEYVSDCVILLDHRVSGQISTRRLRIVKYRGSVHGTNEYPFLIDELGISVLPITSLGLQHEVSTQRVSSGIPRLDAMLGGDGYYRGTRVEDSKLLTCGLSIIIHDCF